MTPPEFDAVPRSPRTPPRRPSSKSVARGGAELRDLPLDGTGPVYGQIYRAIREAILSGRVAAGTRLPTTRALAAELEVSRNTVVSAFEPLQAEGYVVSRVGAGTFVAPQVGSDGEGIAAGAPPRAAGSCSFRDERPRHRDGALKNSATGPSRKETTESGSGVPLRLSRFGRTLESSQPRTLYDELVSRSQPAIDFRPCVPDLERLPYEDWRRHLVRTAHHAPADEFDYADPSGHPALREAIAGYLGRARGVLCDASEIVVVGGVAQALDLATRIFVDAGDAVLLEDPHYLGARRTFEAAGAAIMRAPVDGEGVDPERISQEDRNRCRLAYVTPSHQYPTGVILSLARRLELLRWADESNAYVLEDDYDSEFRYAGRAIPSLKSLDERGRVLYVGTFSKTLLPSMRVAYLVLPRPLVSIFRSAKWLADWAAPSFEQIALARMLESGDFERHLRRARTLYARSRRALVEAIDGELGDFGPAYHDSQAGLHLLLRLDGVPAKSMRAVLIGAAREGIGFYPSSPSYMEPRSVKKLELVMGFGRLEPEAIRAGIQVLRSLLEQERENAVAGAVSIRQ